MSGLEQELNKELKRLQCKYRANYDITHVEWQPTMPSQRPENDLFEHGKARGQCCNDPVNVSRWMIIVYERESAEDAMHVLRHEFFEHLIMKPAKHFVELSNTLLKMINKFQYEDQEDTVEHLTAMEDKCYNKIQKRGKRE